MNQVIKATPAAIEYVLKQRESILKPLQVMETIIEERSNN